MDGAVAHDRSGERQKLGRIDNPATLAGFLTTSLGVGADPSAAGWLRVWQYVPVTEPAASYDGRFKRREGRKGVVRRLYSPVFADYLYVYLDPVGAERAKKSQWWSCATSS